MSDKDNSDVTNSWRIKYLGDDWKMETEITPKPYKALNSILNF